MAMAPSFQAQAPTMRVTGNKVNMKARARFFYRMDASRRVLKMVKSKVRGKSFWMMAMCFLMEAIRRVTKVDLGH